MTSKNLSYYLSFTLLVLSLFVFTNLSFASNLGLAPYFNLAVTSATLLFFLYLEPVIVTSLISLGFVGYLLFYGFFQFVPIASLFILLNLISSYLLSLKLTKEVENERDSFSIILSIILFLSLIYIQSFALLCIKSFTGLNLIIFSFIILAISYLTSRKEKFKIKVYFPEDKQEQFYYCCLIILYLFYGLIYFYPGVLAGDSDKAYMAIAKYFVRENYILLSDPELLRDDMKGFPYFQELYLASGMALSGHYGAKLLACLLAIFKMQIFLIICRKNFAFSLKNSLFTVLSFALIPILLELSCTERPENSLIIFSLALFYFLESSKAMSLEKIASIIFVILCLAFSAKYTAFYLLISFVCVYWRFFLEALKASHRIIFKYWHTILLFSSLTLFWYIRNKVLWGQIVTLQPFSKYHLTVYFPPLRSLNDIYQFLTTSLISSSSYTEYNNLAYGLFSFLVFPSIFIGLTSSGIYRRSILIFIIYVICLTASTRQIRYLAPVAHFPILFIFSKFFLKKHSNNFLFILLAVQLVCAAVVNHRTVLGVGLSQRLHLVEKDFSKGDTTFKEINEIVKYPNTIITSAYDANYNIDAKLLRVDPLWSIAELEEKIIGASHILLAAPGGDPYSFPFFNDLEFFETIFQKEVYTSYLFLFKTKTNRLNELVNYCKEHGLDISKTVIISEAHKNRFPKDLLITEEILLPNLTHRLFRLNGTLKNNRDYGQNNQFISKLPFDKGLLTKGSVNIDPKEVLYLHEDFETKLKVSPFLSLRTNKQNVKADGAMILEDQSKDGFKTYKIKVPQNFQALKIFVNASGEYELLLNNKKIDSHGYQLEKFETKELALKVGLNSKARIDDITIIFGKIN